MGRFTTTHEINCNAETFWRVFFDADFNRKLYLEQLGYPEFNVLEQNETDSTTTRKVSVKPKTSWPGPVAKLFGPDYRYTQEGSFDKSRKVLTWRRISSVQADKIIIGGILRIESVGDTKVRCISENTVEAKIFGVGGLLESTFEKQMREDADASAAFFNRYLAVS